MNGGDGQLVLGIDGGGTGTRCWLASIDDTGQGRNDVENHSAPTILGRGRAGPANLAAVGHDAACRAIDATIDEAFEQAPLPRASVAACVIGAAGGGRETTREPLRQWAQAAGIADRVQVLPDYELVLPASGSDVGVALISGTGSLAFGRDTSGRTARAGGWGYLIHDGGSGFAIGQAALRKLAEEHDRGQPSSRLTRQLLAVLGVERSEEVATAVYAAADPRGQIAVLAETVFVESRRTQVEPALREILATAAAELAGLVDAVLGKLGGALPAGRVAMAGSVLVENPAFADQVRQLLLDRHGQSLEHILVPEPVAGAVRLATRLARARDPST